MATTDKLFTGSIPELYERLLVPLIFEPYARDLAKRVAAAAPQNVLETAAGTGVLTRAMASCLPATTRIVATDLNQPMLDEAAKRQPGDTRIERKQADALALPFADASFDVVACQFGTMFFPDKVQGYREARRVLRSRGRLMFNAWDKIAANEFADIITQALAEIFPHDPPRNRGARCWRPRTRDRARRRSAGPALWQRADRRADTGVCCDRELAKGFSSLPGANATKQSRAAHQPGFFSSRNGE